MKIIKRFLVVLFGLLAALVLFFFGSIGVDLLTGGSRLDAVTNTRVTGQNGAPDVKAFVVRPQGKGPFPTVIMIHEFFGLNESIIGKAKGLAEAGYLVIAPDTFRGSTTTWIPRAILQVITNPAEQVNQDLDTIFTWLAAQPDVLPERVAVMGFCYGGRAALTYSLHNNRIAATAVFYGSPETDVQVLKTLPGPVLGIFGGADSSIPLTQVRAFDQALATAGVKHEVTIYDGQPHAFVTDMDSIRKGGTQGQAWAQLLAFLESNLKNRASSSPSTALSDYTQPFDWRYYMMLVVEHAFGGASHSH